MRIQRSNDRHRPASDWLLLLRPLQRSPTGPGLLTTHSHSTHALCKEQRPQLCHGRGTGTLVCHNAAKLDKTSLTNHQFTIHPHFATPLCVFRGFLCHLTLPWSAHGSRLWLAGPQNGPRAHGGSGTVPVPTQTEYDAKPPADPLMLLAAQMNDRESRRIYHHPVHTSGFPPGSPSQSHRAFRGVYSVENLAHALPCCRLSRLTLAQKTWRQIAQPAHAARWLGYIDRVAPMSAL